MKIEEYGNHQLRLINDLGGHVDNLMHMAAGISGEAGEVLDGIKKTFAYGKPIDRAHLIEELGDILFYVNGMIALLDTSWDEVLTTNIRKLEARYPSGTFNADHAIHRDTAAEKAAMEGA